MLLSKIVELAYYRTDEDIADKEVAMDTIFINAINQGAGIIATTLEKKTKTTTITYAENLQLPVDFHSLVEIKHSTYGKLSPTDFDIQGDLLIHKVSTITSGSFTLTYIFAPVVVSSENSDVPLKDYQCISLAAFASYQYMLSLKETQVAQMFLNEFMIILGKGANNAT